MKSIKSTVSLWIVVISTIILLASVLCTPKIIKEKTLESTLPTMESYVFSIRDNVDSTLVAYSKQLEQLNCYRINDEWDSQRIGTYLYEKKKFTTVIF